MHLLGAAAPAPGRPRRGSTEGKGECNAADIDVQYLNKSQSKIYAREKNPSLIMDPANNEAPGAGRGRSRPIDGTALAPP